MKGAAFGLAGVVKGLGLSALKGYAIMDALRAGVESKVRAAINPLPAHGSTLMPRTALIVDRASPTSLALRIAFLYPPAFPMESV